MTPHPHFQDHKSGNQLSRTLLRVIVMSFYLSACVYPAVTPTPSAVPTSANVLPPASTSITASSFALTSTPLVLTTGTPLLETFTPGPSPTPTCVAPVGWVRYTVQAGDNLFRLGIKTNTTVDDIKSANCLTSEVIYTGDPLFLPFAPPTAVPIPPTAIPPFICRGPFSCPSGSLPSFALPAGGSNGAAFVSCKDPGSPRIEPFPPSSKLELGTRLYLFVCDFPSDHQASTAKITISQGSQISEIPVDLLPPELNPDLPDKPDVPEDGRAQFVIDWPALPTRPISKTEEDKYILTVSSADGQITARHEFQVIQPTTEHILVVPAIGSPGTTFDVYYTNFKLDSTQTIDFYGEDEPVVGKEHPLSKRDEWHIPITNKLSDTEDKGWAMQEPPLQSFPGDRMGAYAIRYGFTNIYDVIWLVP
jgi:LysM repeat protein